jgi:hypothetical protein
MPRKKVVGTANDVKGARLSTGGNVRLLLLFGLSHVLLAQLAPAEASVSATVPTPASWWPVIGAISAGVIGPVGLISTLAIYFIRSTVKVAILEANKEQLKELEGKYVPITAMETAILKANVQQLKDLEGKYIPAATSSITGREIEKILTEDRTDLEKMRADLMKLEKYAHDRVHTINNMLQIKVATQVLGENP